MLKIKTDTLNQFVELTENIKFVYAELAAIAGTAALAGTLDFDVTMEIEEKVNPYGGNNTLDVSITLEAMYYTSGRMFVHLPASETKEAFINKLKAYCFDTVVDIMTNARVFA